MTPEAQLGKELLDKLRNLRYVHRTVIRDRANLGRNSRENFQALNSVKLMDGEFQRLFDENITPAAFSAVKTLRGTNSFTPRRWHPRLTTRWSISRAGATPANC